MTNPEPPSDPLAKHPQPPVDGGGLPYYTPPPEEPTPGPTGQMPPLGGLGRRLVARIIDGVLVAVVAVPLSLIATAAKRNDRQLYSLIIEIVVLLLYFLYEGLMLTRSHGQTVGKKVMRIRVANLADGTPPVGSPGWTRAAVWTLPGILCCGAWPLVDGLWATWDQPYAQAVHDKAARTVVVRTDW